MELRCLKLPSTQGWWPKLLRCMLHKQYSVTLTFYSLLNMWILATCTTCKVSKYGVFYRPYFPAFGLNTERYGVSLRVQSKCVKIRARKNSVFRLFSRSVEQGNKLDCIVIWLSAHMKKVKLVRIWENTFISDAKNTVHFNNHE